LHFGVVHLVAGRRTKAGRCVRQTTANRHAHKCTRRVTLAGSFTRAGGAGANSFRFTGRFNARTLAPGSYRLTAVPVAGTKTGATVSGAFQVTK
jgi:hypothetical protein